MCCEKCGREIPDESKVCPYCDIQHDNKPKKDNSGFAIAGFVMSLLGLGILGIIFGILGLKSKNRGLAIAAIIISALDLLVQIVSVIAVPIMLSSGGIVLIE